MYSPDYEPLLQDIASQLGMQRDWLYNVVMMESAWNPAAYNKSGAVGLIQFMPQTLKGMRLLSNAADALVPGSGPVPEAGKQAAREDFLSKYPDVESQLQDPVLAYFQKYKSYPTEQSVYMAVFYPDFRNASPGTVFPANVQAQNPGIVTVADYTDLVHSHVATREAVAFASKPSTLLGLAVLAAGTYYVLTS